MTLVPPGNPLYNHDHIVTENYSHFRQLDQWKVGVQRHLVGAVLVLRERQSTLCIVRTRQRAAVYYNSRSKLGKMFRNKKYVVSNTCYAVAEAHWSGGITEISAYPTLTQAAAALKNNSSAPHFSA